MRIFLDANIPFSAAKAPKFGAVLERLLAECHSAPFRPITPEIDQALVALPEKDRPVLAAAIRLGCDVLITGDKTHFGSLYGSRVRGVAVHSPATFLQRSIPRSRLDREPHRSGFGDQATIFCVDR